MTDSILEDGDDNDLLIELGLDQLGARLLKLEGRVFVRLSGVVEAGGLRVPYELVPAQGVLAKPAKWRRLDAQARGDMLRERVTAAAASELNKSVAAFV